MIGVSITKEVQWRGHTERFSNVYHYTTPGDLGVESARVVIREIVNAEKPVHASDVKFVEGRVWTAGGTPAENETVLIETLDEQGTAVGSAAMDREAAYLVEFKTARPSATGRPVTLKKFIHACSVFGASSLGVLAGTEKVAGAAQSALATYANAVRELDGNITTGTLCAPSGSGRTAQTAFVYDWIEHREFN